jgi:DNA mismatch repair protein MutL
VTQSIRILPEALADQIAAGEVVERPASVVKELLENAVDASATRVTVEIEQGGQSLIRVSDDGTGMSPDDAQLSVQRHATSKLRTRDDLFAITTLGFRGEALPSIASVSRFRLLTRPRDRDAGTRVDVDGGQRAAGAPSEVGCAPGTSVEVRELFYNVPARLKFLKAKPTESAHVAAVCLRAALSRPELALTLTRDGRVSHDFPRAEHLHARVVAAFPDETLVRYDAEFDGVRMTASLGAPERARSGSAQLHLFVNRRPVRDMALARSVAYAYGSVLPPGRFPAGALFLELDPSEVDVNVHPQKLEVRFAAGRKLLDALTRSLARKLGTSAWSGPASRGTGYWQGRLSPASPSNGWAGVQGSADLASGAAGAGYEGAAVLHAFGAAPGPMPSEPNDASGPHAAGATDAGDAGDPWGLAGGGPSPAPFADRVAELAASLDPRTHALLPQHGFFGSLRVLAQSRKMFLICEGPTGLFVLDQHAADERVRFDQLRRSYGARTVRVQRLLFPERVECTELEALRVEQHADELVQLGLECTRLGPHTVAVAAVPALLRRASPSRLLRDLLAELARSGERAFTDALDMALATMACHGAIRAGDALSPEEIVALLRALDEVQDFQGHCPHGRPILCSLPWDEMERRLGR